MNDNSNDLKAWREGVAAGGSCLTLDSLQRLMDGAPVDSSNAQHVAECPHCQAELAMLKSFESSATPKGEQEDVNWIVAQLQRTRAMSDVPVHAPIWRSLTKFPQLAAAAALVLIIGLSFSLYISGRQDRPLLQGGSPGSQNLRSGDIRLSEPSGDLDRTPERFRWEALPLAKGYSIQLLEVDNTVLWSGHSADNSLVTSPEMKTMMRPGKTLLWKVTALDASGKTISSSSPERFRLTSGQMR